VDSFGLGFCRGDFFRNGKAEFSADRICNLLAFRGLDRAAVQFGLLFLGKRAPWPCSSGMPVYF
jgi:hypothetical protein